MGLVGEPGVCEESACFVLLFFNDGVHPEPGDGECGDDNDDDGCAEEEQALVGERDPGEHCVVSLIRLVVGRRGLGGIVWGFAGVVFGWSWCWPYFSDGWFW